MKCMCDPPNCFFRTMNSKSNGTKDYKLLSPLFKVVTYQQQKVVMGFLQRP
jgi:hypothetical protein